MEKIIPPKYFKMNLNKKPLTKPNLLTQVCDVEIYNFYLGREVGIQSAISSPFREDKKPSFGFFIGISGEVCWKDFVKGSGDCLDFVKELFGLNFNEALVKVVQDFGLEDEFDFVPLNIPKTHNEKIQVDRMSSVKRLSEFRKIDIRRRKSQLYDIEFWLSFGVTKESLIKYNVTPIEYYFINGNIIKTDKYAYAFIEYKDGVETYKIYQPFNDTYKWINNHNDSVWQGWTQLPAKGETLIITKSLKDVMSISEVLKLPTVALQSESVLPKKNVIEELHRRFEDIYILYDNDFDKEKNWGEIYSKKLAQEFNFYHIQIQTKRDCKDFSDLVKKYGAVTSKQLWDNELSIPY
jgi:hypothetical protein